MLYYPEKLNEIAEKLDKATIAWLKAAQEHNDNEAHLNGVVNEIRAMQDKEEGVLCGMGFTLLYDYENREYLAVETTDIECMQHI